MLKTIFSKLIVVFVTILILSFSITGVMLYYFMGDFVSSEKVKSLELSAGKINDNLNLYLINYGNPIAESFFKQAIKFYSDNALVWVVDSDGYIRFENVLTSEMKKNLLFENGSYRLPDKDQYNSVMSGSSTVTKTGDFYGFFKDYSYSWLTVEKPFKSIARDGTQTVYAIYLHTPIKEVQKLRTSVFKFFLISVSISIAVSIIFIYIFSLRISKPLKEIKKAARHISSGEFRRRLDIKSQDEIGELANSFNQMASSLQNLEELRRGFIANVSHELRTPMTSIRGFIEGILDGTITLDRQKYYLTIVRDETNRLNRLVNDLLDLAKIESGEMVINRRNFELNELIRRSVINFEHMIVEKGIQVDADFEEEKMFVYADPDAIERVIINLIHNAIKFTGQDGKLNITTRSQKDKIYVSVSDDGIGIDKEEIELIWDRFYKSDKSRGKDRSGTGLGLAIIKSIINEHNEEISVESELGKGTKFTFTIAKAAHDEVC